MSLSLPGAPKAISTALEVLLEALRREAGTEFAGLILYGGLARGRYREGRSDVNVVVLLRRAHIDVLERIGPALRNARRVAGVDAMLLTPDEVPAAALEFATRFLDIKRHRIVLAGEDPFAGLEVPRVMVQLRIAQSLRDMLTRMRCRYATAYDDAQRLREELIKTARPLAIEMLALLHDGEYPVPDNDQTAAVFASAAAAFNLDGDSLASLATLRSARNGSRIDPGELYGRILGVVAALADRADALAGAPA